METNKAFYCCYFILKQTLVIYARPVFFQTMQEIKFFVWRPWDKTKNWRVCRSVNYDISKLPACCKVLLSPETKFDLFINMYNLDCCMFVLKHVCGPVMIFLLLLAGVWSWFGSQSSDEDDSSLLANQSLLLLLVLVNHCTQGKKKQNPYRHALFAFKNRKVKGMAPLFIYLSVILLTYMTYSMVGLYCRDYPSTEQPTACLVCP